MTEIAMISYGDRIISPTVWDKALLHPSGRSREQPPPTTDPSPFKSRAAACELPAAVAFFRLAMRGRPNPT